MLASNNELGFLIFVLETGCAVVLAACLCVIVGVIEEPWSNAIWYVSPVWIAMLVIIWIPWFAKRS